MIGLARAMPDSPASSLQLDADDTRRPFVVVTGLSGAGRVTALHALDDMGYVAVDNVPLPLLGDLMRSTSGDRGEMAAPLAFGVDTRTYGFDPHDLVRRLKELRDRRDLAARLLFLDCDSDVLQRRYTESRRPHPLAPDRPLLDAIAEERRQVRWVRDSADLVVDTSTLSPHQFKQILMGHFALGRSVGTRLSVMSFSYRRGLPREADLVFDVRFLKNPHYVAELKPLTGRDPPVAAYVASDPGYAAFMNGLKALIAPLLPRFDTEGKSYLTIAIGCTGGRHRSVTVAEELADWLRGAGRSVTLSHRDAAVAGEAGGVGANG